MFVVYLLLFVKFNSLIGSPVEHSLAFHRVGRGSCPILRRTVSDISGLQDKMQHF